jgi:GntR family transcriptional regulator
VEELSGRRYDHASDHWIARMPTPTEADALDLPTGSPVMHVLHVARADDGTVLEVSESTWPADGIMVLDDYQIEQTPAQPDAASEI